MKVTVWNEYRHEKSEEHIREVYPEGIHTQIASFLKENGIMCVFHYIPLHSAPAGMKFGEFYGEDEYTTKESERLARLPMYYGLTMEQVDYIISKVKEFYNK